MGKNEELFAEPPKRLLGAEDLPDIAHHIVYDWGTLQVTSDANSSYELVPLIANIEPGPYRGESPRNNNEPAVNVLLLGPNEPLADVPAIPAGLTPVTTKCFVDRDGVGILLNFGSTKDEAVATHMDVAMRIVQDVQIEGITDLELHSDMEGIPWQELLANKLPQAYAHVLADSAREFTATVASEIYRKRDVQYWKNHFARLGALSMMGAAGILTSATMATGRVSGLSIGLAGGYMAGSQLLQHYQLAKYMDSEPQFRLVHEFKARQLGKLVGNDIHITYCSRHFEESLQGTDSDGNIEN